MALQAKFVPGEMQLEIWNQIIKFDPEYGQDAWLKYSVGSLLDKWTGHPSAAPFNAQKPDSALSGLRFLGLKGVNFTRTSSYLRAHPVSSDNNDYCTFQLPIWLMSWMHWIIEDYTKYLPILQ